MMINLLTFNSSYQIINRSKRVQSIHIQAVLYEIFGKYISLFNVNKLFQNMLVTIQFILVFFIGPINIFYWTIR